MIGIDLVKVDRIQKLIEKYQDHFLNKIFSPIEIKYAESASDTLRYERYAARFAAKEAIVKALGTGFRKITWKDIEIIKDSLDAPKVKLSKRAQNFCAQKQIQDIALSISHTHDYAVASALIIKN